MLIYRSVFSFSKIAPLKRYGFEPETIPKIPQYDFPTRAYVEGEEQIPKQDIYNYLCSTFLTQNSKRNSFQDVDTSPTSIKGKSIMSSIQQGFRLEE